MAEDRSYIERNRAALARLRGLVERLSDEQLVQPLSNGLTAAEVLAHVAFWDGRALYLAEKWDNGGPGPQPKDYEPVNVDWINDAMRPLFQLIPPRQAAQFAVQQAERVDQKVAALTDVQLAQNRAAGSPLNVLRAAHRLEHVEELAREFGLG
ncbi:MAG TPA: DinB family protein [Caldilineaceae bacterium]|nr:DinB family protein [Caldilineaceae bacterium]